MYRNYHRSGFEHFASILCLFLWTDFVKTKASQDAKMNLHRCVVEISKRRVWSELPRAAKHHRLNCAFGLSGVTSPQDGVVFILHRKGEIPLIHFIL